MDSKYVTLLFPPVAHTKSTLIDRFHFNSERLLEKAFGDQSQSKIEIPLAFKSRRGLWFMS